MVALMLLALKIIFPYGPLSAEEDGDENPAYVRMTFMETGSRFLGGGLLVCAAFAVFFTMEALKNEREQTKWLQEDRRLLLRQVRQKAPKKSST